MGMISSKVGAGKTPVLVPLTSFYTNKYFSNSDARLFASLPMSNCKTLVWFHILADDMNFST
ncbi:hypothetical protein AVO44_05550 [Ruegeria profundi]|uniref:Uncharacterized protein n=1 Tax=Ruegeria profundi TaxID=1685378 RepID=A0A0X3TZU4_9RHOB|nr:hypothetical protein AVO44_05550 [Ruegeria profundi]